MKTDIICHRCRKYTSAKEIKCVHCNRSMLNTTTLEKSLNTVRDLETRRRECLKGLADFQEKIDKETGKVKKTATTKISRYEQLLEQEKAALNEKIESIVAPYQDELKSRKAALAEVEKSLERMLN